MMNISDIDRYLRIRKYEFDQNIYDETERLRLKAIEEANESDANLCWCYKEVFDIQMKYIRIFNLLKHPSSNTSGKLIINGHKIIVGTDEEINEDKRFFADAYEEAWCLLEHVDIAIGNLIPNFDIGTENKDPYLINFIMYEIKQLIKLYPYKVFASREEIIREEVCSICGAKISLRGGCNHRVGKLYMGEFCYRIVKDLQFLGVALVRDPFDMYAVLKPAAPEFKFNYSIIDETLKQLKSPYERWYVDILPVKKEAFNRKIGRNDKCPCGSGKKYKRCCLGTSNELTDHYRISYLKQDAIGQPMRYLNSRK